MSSRALTGLDRAAAARGRTFGLGVSCFLARIRALDGGEMFVSAAPRSSSPRRVNAIAGIARPEQRATCFADEPPGRTNESCPSRRARAGGRRRIALKCARRGPHYNAPLVVSLDRAGRQFAPTGPVMCLRIESVRLEVGRQHRRQQARPIVLPSPGVVLVGRCRRAPSWDWRAIVI